MEMKQIEELEANPAELSRLVDRAVELLLFDRDQRLELPRQIAINGLCFLIERAEGEAQRELSVVPREREMMSRRRRP